MGLENKVLSKIDKMPYLIYRNDILVEDSNNKNTHK